MGVFNTFRALVTKSPEFVEQETADQSAPAQPARPTVLVIDDDQQFLDSVRPVLSAGGFNVLASTSGPKGLNLLRYAPHNIDAMLLDYCLPGFDGEQTLQFARRLRPSLKIVGVTGLNPFELSAAYREGVDALFVKPFRNAELLASLHAIVSGGGSAPPGGAA